MKGTAFLAGGAGLLVILGAGCDRFVPVPPEIKDIRCQQDSKRLASGGYEIFRIAGTTLAAPCLRAGSLSGLEQGWQRELEKDPSHRYAPAIKRTSLDFRKRPDGRFEVSDDIGQRLPPSASRTRYELHAEISPQDVGPMRADLFERRLEISIPTPPAFAATGPETTFWCRSPKLHHEMHNECWARPRSKSLYWIIAMTFGRPAEDELDMRPEVAEAYHLLAAHILRQE